MVIIILGHGFYKEVVLVKDGLIRQVHCTCTQCRSSLTHFHND